MDEMDCRRLSESELHSIFKHLLRRDFPLLERKPYSSVRPLIQRDAYQGWALFDEGEVAAYALLICPPGSPAQLLDYLAVVGEQRRGGGLGSQLLDRVAQALPPGCFLLGEIENIAAAANEAERAVRQRRRHFYEKNGWRCTAVGSRVLGVEYTIICRGPAESDDQVERELMTAYRLQFPAWLRPFIVRLRRGGAQ